MNAQLHSQNTHTHTQTNAHVNIGMFPWEEVAQLPQYNVSYAVCMRYFANGDFRRSL